MDTRISITAMVLTGLLVAVGLVVNSGAEAADTVVMHAGGGTFAPQVTTIKVGERVTWVNESRTDDVFVTASGPVDRKSTVGQDDLEMNGVVHPGTTYTHLFKAPGTYYYFCAGHMQMWGTVIVRQNLIATETK